MSEDIIGFITNAPFAAVLWELRKAEGNEDFYMLTFNELANSFDSRDFSICLGEPYLKHFSEALEIQQAFYQALRENRPLRFADFEHSGFRDTPNFFRIWIIPVGTNKVLILYQNITNEKKELVYKETQDLVQQLQTSNQTLEQYAHLVAHDFRSPLRAIGSYTDLIKMNLPAQDDKLQNYFKIVSDNIKTMNEMISGFLEMSKINSVELDFDILDITQILNSVISSMVKVNENKPNIDLTSSKQCLVYGNKLLIFQLFKNLIENSLKFTEREPRSQKLSITVKEINQQFENDYIIVELQDNGIGIETENLEEIFKPLSKLNESTKYQGSGLGLAICKSIVNVHKGLIWAESEPGVGSTFFVQLPRYATEKIADKNY